MTWHTAWVTLYVPADGGEPELQGAGSARMEGAAIALKCAENILGVATWDEADQAWIGEGGGMVVVRPVDFEWPKGEEE